MCRRLKLPGWVILACFLGLEWVDKSQPEVLVVLAEYKDAGNMNNDQNTQVLLIPRLALYLALGSYNLRTGLGSWLVCH